MLIGGGKKKAKNKKAKNKKGMSFRARLKAR